jgi:hypothetical protein
MNHSSQPSTDRLYQGLPEQLGTFAEALRPYLCRHGATFYRTEVKGELRAGWCIGKRNRVGAILKSRRSGVMLQLPLGSRPAAPSPVSWQRIPGSAWHRTLLTSATLPEGFGDWLERAIDSIAEGVGSVSSLRGERHVAREPAEEQSERRLCYGMLDNWPNPVTAGVEAECFVQGRHSLYRIRLTVVDGLLTCRVAVPVLKGTRRKRLLREINDANRYLMMGHFEFSAWRNALEYRAGMLLHDGGVGKGAVDSITRYAVAMVDVHLPDLQAAFSGEEGPSCET